MKALSKTQAAKGLELIDAPVPEPAAGEVRIRIDQTAICGTDVHIWDWNQWAQDNIPYPIITGHEYVGHVDKVGDAVKHIKVGDRVSGEGHVTCGICRNCRNGHGENCIDYKGVGVTRSGAFAEYLVIPERNVWKLDDAISDDVASVLDPLGNATMIATRYDVRGEDVLVTGAGPIGIMVGAIVKFCGARSVVITDVNDFRLGQAEKMGLTTLNPTKGSLADVRKKLHIDEGFTVGYEISGAPSALHDIIKNMINGGKIALLGLYGRETVDLPLNMIIDHGLLIQGIWGRKQFETWYKMSGMLQGGLDITPIITDHFSYKEYREGFEKILAGKTGKVILDWKNI